VNNLRKELAIYGIDVMLRKKALDLETFKKDALQSNKILIAGKTLEEWLEAKTGQIKCCDTCGDAERRTVEYADETHEAIPAALIVRAGFVAASKVFDVKSLHIAERKPILKIMRRLSEKKP